MAIFGKMAMDTKYGPTILEKNTVVVLSMQVENTAIVELQQSLEQSFATRCDDLVSRCLSMEARGMVSSMQIGWGVQTSQ